MARDEGAGAASVLLAFILGAVSGAAVALLYAPAPGRETRARAVEAAERGRLVVEKGRQVVSEGREVLANAIERGREAYQQARADTSSRGGERG